MSNFLEIVNWLIHIVLFLVSIHIPSFVKASVAYRLYGDSTPKVNGRMVWWNPLPNLDILGTISLFFIYISWSKPMDLSWNDLKNNRVSNVYIELSDCFTSLILGLIACLFHLMFSKLQLALNLDLRSLMFILDIFASFNVFMFFFKLLPIPQLPGFRILTGLFYRKPQGVFDSLSLTLMGTAIIVILAIWSPIPQWLGYLTSSVLKPFAVMGSTYLPWLDKIPGIGGF